MNSRGLPASFRSNAMYAALVALVSAACAQGQSADAGETVKSAFAAELSSRAGVATEIKAGRRDAISAIHALRSAVGENGPASAEERLEFGTAVIDIGMRLDSAGDKLSARKVFTEAERILAKAAKQFDDTQKKKRANALYSLGHIRTTYLGSHTDALEAFDAALNDDPSLEAVKSARTRLLAQWGSFIEAARKAGNSSKPAA